MRAATFKFLSAVAMTMVSACGEQLEDEFLDEEVSAQEEMLQAGLPNYLIITAPKFASSLTDFVNFRTASGFNVEVVSTTTTGKLKTQIKDFIQARFNNTATRPQYLLLVGDVDEIPYWLRNEIFEDDRIANRTGWSTDLGYSLLSGNDILPDVYYGRFPAATVDQLKNMIDKTIRTETISSKNNKKALFLSGTEKRVIAKATHELIINQNLAPNGFTGNDFYTTTNYKAQAVSLINQGVLFLQYDGHGTLGSWVDGLYLGKSDIPGLTNTVHPLVFGGACETGYYAMTEALAETWVRAKNGAAAYIGASDDTPDEHAVLMGTGLYDAFFRLKIKRVGEAMNKIKLDAYAGLGYGPSKNFFSQYNLMGDPALQMVW